MSPFVPRDGDGGSKGPRRSRRLPVLLMASVAAVLAAHPLAAVQEGPERVDVLAPPPQGAFLLTSEDLEGLAVPGGSPVWGIAFEGTDTSAIAGAFTRMLSEEPDALLGLLDARFADSASVLAAIDTVLGPGAGSPGAPPPPVVVDDALEAPPPDTTARVLGDSLRARVRSYPPPDDDLGPPVPEMVREELAELVGVWFPDAHMFRTAIRLVYARVDQPVSERAVRRILGVAHLNRATLPDSLSLQPLAWTGGGCGCGVYVEGEVWEPEFYGIYPFWKAPQGTSAPAPLDTLDLSMLTRVGYYGLTFDALGRIQDPRHWRTGAYPEGGGWWGRRDFSDFAVTAHNHKVNVDAVVYQGDWSWLPDTLAGSEDALEAVFSTLRDELLALISPPLGNFMDRVKPVVSLGQTRRRTLGDGVTLHFDLTQLDVARQAELFDLVQESGFFRSLHDSLTARAEEDGRLFDADLDYRLNLIVPLECMERPDESTDTGRCGFFSIPNLVELRRDSVDLFLVDMTAVRQGSPMAEMDLAERTRRLRAAMDRLPAPDQYALAPNLIPLAALGSDDSPEDFVLVSDMSFRGVGGWSVTEMEQMNGWLREIFLAQPPRGWLAARFHEIEETLCRYMCPIRWPVRLGILATALLYLAFWVATEYRSPWKRFYRSPLHSALVVAFCLAFVATLWCDPYWKERETLIVSGIALVGLVVFVVAQARLRRERYYP